MHDYPTVPECDRPHIELAIARARQERAQAAGNLLRQIFRRLWTCPECYNTRIMFQQRFENGEAVGPVEEIPCDYPGCNRYSVHAIDWPMLKTIRNGWVALFGVRRKLPRNRTPLSEDERRALRPPPVAILMNALHDIPDRCGNAVIGKYKRLPKEFRRCKWPAKELMR